MQVGDYIMQQPDKFDDDYFRIFKVLRICINGYLEVEFQAIYNSLNKLVFSNFDRNINLITTARIKPYHPTFHLRNNHDSLSRNLRSRCR